MDLQFGFDILAPVLATFPNIGRIFVQFSGHSVNHSSTANGHFPKIFPANFGFGANKLECFQVSLLRVRREPTQGGDPSWASSITGSTHNT